MTKRLLAVFLTLALTLSLAVPALAAAPTENADRLHALGLFQGTGSGYELEKVPTRMQGLIMLIRLLGEEQAALACEDVCPFRDVAAGDFTYATSLQKAAELGFVECDSAVALTAADPVFYRADLVDLSLAALTAGMRDGGTLAERLVSKGVFTGEQGRAQGVLGAPISYRYQSRDYSTVTRTTNAYALPSGKVTADVVTVNLLNPAVRVKTAMVRNTLGTTANFKDIVATSDAAVVVNGNFFEAYNQVPIPIGHMMVDGEFLYGVSGLNCFAFGEGGTVQTGKLSVFFYVEGGGSSWACYECNSSAQSSDLSVLYTPAFGPSVPITCAGVVTTVSGGVIQSSQTVAAGTTAAIPADGYVMFFGNGFASTEYYRQPQAGASVTMTPRTIPQDTSGIDLTGVTSIVSGAPCLVSGGQICTDLEDGFNSDARFTTATTPRTAIGRRTDGKLVIVSTGAATIQQLRELMHQLGCTDAINLDGGASTALAWQGKVIRPAGRELTTTLQVFVDG